VLDPHQGVNETISINIIEADGIAKEIVDSPFCSLRTITGGRIEASN
jgi:hypothetical protein